MKILKSIITLSFVLLLSNVEAQIGVGSKEKGKSPTKFKEKYLERLKQSETIFFCRTNDDIELFQKELSKVWNYTKKITCVPADKKSEYDLRNVNYSYVDIFKYTHTKSNSTNGSHTSHNKGAYSTTGVGGVNQTKSYTYSLRLFVKKKSLRKFFCSINLTPSHINNHTDVRIGKVKNIIFSNWGAGYIALYLKNVNKHLKNNELQSKYLDFTKKNEIGKLKRHTLYVQESSLLDLFFKLKDDKKIFELYNFDYKIISNEDLNKKLMTDENFYFLAHYFGSITVFNKNTSDIVYSKRSIYPIITTKKIKKLSKSISKY